MNDENTLPSQSVTPSKGEMGQEIIKLQNDLVEFFNGKKIPANIALSALIPIISRFYSTHGSDKESFLKDVADGWDFEHRDM